MGPHATPYYRAAPGFVNPDHSLERRNLGLRWLATALVFGPFWLESHFPVIFSLQMRTLRSSY
jgi:hypothetical protein